jgi:hypothetical protein
LEPQPQPVPPLCFTSASSAQHAPESFGAAPPQQPVVAAGAGLEVVVSVSMVSIVFVMLMESLGLAGRRSLSAQPPPVRGSNSPEHVGQHVARDLEDPRGSRPA